MLDRGLSANPGSLPLKIALVRHELRGGDPAAALTIAEEAQAAALNDAVVLDVLWRTQLGSGAAGAGGGDLRLNPRAAPGCARGAAHARPGPTRRKNASGAELSLKKALALKPDSIEAQRLLMAFAGASQDEAGVRSRSQRRSRSNARRPQTGFWMEATICSARRSSPAAASIGVRCSSSRRPRRW